MGAGDEQTCASILSLACSSLCMLYVDGLC